MTWLLPLCENVYHKNTLVLLRPNIRIWSPDEPVFGFHFQYHPHHICVGLMNHTAIVDAPHLDPHPVRGNIVTPNPMIVAAPACLMATSTIIIKTKRQKKETKKMARPPQLCITIRIIINYGQYWSG